MLRFGLDGAVVGVDGDRPTSRGPAGPAASAVGAVQTHTHPTSRGWVCCVFGLDEAVVGVDGDRPTSRGLPPAAVFGDGRRRTLQLHANAHPPHEQGSAGPAASALGSVQTTTHPTSRGLPPAAVGGTGDGGRFDCT